MKFRPFEIATSTLPPHETASELAAMSDACATSEMRLSLLGHAAELELTLQVLHSNKPLKFGTSKLAWADDPAVRAANTAHTTTLRRNVKLCIPWLQMNRRLVGRDKLLAETKTIYRPYNLPYAFLPQTFRAIRPLLNVTA